jgi:hypothetical protein
MHLRCGAPFSPNKQTNFKVSFEICLFTFAITGRSQAIWAAQIGRLKVSFHIRFNWLVWDFLFGKSNDHPAMTPTRQPAPQ